jgi:parvulin-like peptidyl-prolyl isomerase
VPATTPAITPVAATVSAGSGGGSLRYTQMKVVASIGHEAVITDDEVWQMVRARMREYADLTGEKRDAKEKAIFKEELKELIGRELLVLELFDRMRKNKLDGKVEELKKYASDGAERDINERRKRNGLEKLSEAEFISVLQAQGLSYKTLKRQLEQETLSRIYLEQMLKDKIKYVSINDLWDFYQSHQSDFKIEDDVEWLDLFVLFRNFATQDAAKAHATAAWKSAMAGSDFADLVQKYGQGDSNLRKGEGVGRKKGEIQPAEIEPILLDMDAGQVSPLLMTATGYHIVKVVKRTKAGTLPFDEKVQSMIRMKLNNRVQELERQRIIEELWRKHRPKVNDL